MEHFLTDTVASYGYLAVFLMMAIGSACIPIPSEIVLLYGGALASADFAAAGKELNLVVVVAVAVAGSMAGSWATYGVGFAGGRPLIDRWGRYLLLRPHEVDRAHAWFERHGEAAVFFARLLPIVRAFISLPAGVARMPFWRFSIYTLLGNIPWCLGIAWAGYLLGQRWHTFQRYFTPVVLAVGAVLLVLLVWWVVKRLRARRVASGTGADAGA
jgi:membrane protein DedA with SNARE-associated domain